MRPALAGRMAGSEHKGTKQRHKGASRSRLTHCMVSSAPANYAMQCSSARPTPPSSATTTAPGATSKLPVHDPVVTH